MKRNIFLYLSLVLVAVVAASCNMRSSMTPSVKVASQVVRTSLAGVTDTISFGDSLQVGDTVRLGMICNGFYDCLTSFVVSADSTKVKPYFVWEGEITSVLEDNSDPAHGILYFKPEEMFAFYTTLYYVPQSSGSHRLDFDLRSAAQEPYSRFSGYFTIDVK